MKKQSKPSYKQKVAQKESFATGNRNSNEEASQKSTMEKTVSRLKLKALEEATYGLYIALTPRTVEKRWKTKERIRKITAMLKVSPSIFERGSTVENAWKVRPSARESHLVRKLKEKLQDRKGRMKIFATNKMFDQILEVTEREEKKEDPAQASIAGKFEYMARELIDKTAYLQARLQHGVWSRTGIPYSCLGLPALNRPPSAPFPELDKLQEDSFAMYPFDFFPILPNQEDTGEVVGDEFSRQALPSHIARREAILKAAKTASTISLLLTKMGLLHLHGGSWLEDIIEGLLSAAPRALSVVPYSGRTVVGPIGNIEHFGDTDSSSTKSVPHETSVELDKLEHHAYVNDKLVIPSSSWLQRPGHAHSQESFAICQSESKEMLIEPKLSSLEGDIDWRPHEQLIFNLKKKNRFKRKVLLHDLNRELTSISDRRTHWRYSSNFSAEICKGIETLLFATNGRRTPTTKQIWKIAEKHHPLKRKESTPPFETEVQSIYRFYERVSRFIDHQKMADPLMDILLYFLKEIFEVEKLPLQPEVLLRLCERLAGIPEEVADSGRMVCIMPILQFIAKELHITSAEFDEYIIRSKVDDLQPSVYRRQAN